MDELSQIGRKLIDAAMEHDEPPPADESWGTIVSRITTEAPREEAPSQPRPTPRPWWTWIALATILSAAAVASWWWWGRPPQAAVVQEPSDPPPIPVSPGAAPPEKRTASAPDVEHLVADAEAALAAGDPDRAMALLQRHAEVAAIHPQAERRMALRILVLCAQGEQDKARDEARAFLAGHPDSQWASDVRSSCAAP